MVKSILIICFFWIPLLSFSQIDDELEEDSAYFEDDFIKDTTSTTHIGFVIGGISQGVYYKVNTNISEADSLSFDKGKPNVGFMLGLIYDKDLSDRLWLRSGLFVSVSKLNITYDYQNSHHNYYFNHSTLEVPFWLNYAFSDLRKGLSWGAGLKGSLDISKKEDKNDRVFKLNAAELLIGTGPGMRWQLGSGNLINASLGFNVSVFNLFTDNSNNYNQSIDSGRRWQVQLIFGIN